MPPPSEKINFYDHFIKICFKNRFFFKICPYPPKNRFSIILIKKGPLIRKNWFLQSFYQNLAPQNRFSVLWIKKKTLSSLEYENCFFSKSLIQNSSKTRFYVIFKRCSRWSMQKGFFSKIQFYVTFKNIPPPEYGKCIFSKVLVQNSKKHVELLLQKFNFSHKFFKSRHWLDWLFLYVRYTFPNLKLRLLPPVSFSQSPSRSLIRQVDCWE